jgi:hypothetical protein
MTASSTALATQRKKKWDAMQKSLFDLGLVQTRVYANKVFPNKVFEQITE